MREIHLLHFKGIVAHDWLFREVLFPMEEYVPMSEKALN